MTTDHWLTDFQTSFAQAATDLNLQTLDRLVDFYVPEALFVDPFAQLRGRAAIRASYRSMLVNLHGAHFVCEDWAQLKTSGPSPETMLTWQFRFKVRSHTPEVCIPGASRLRLDADRRAIAFHQDYWDGSALLEVLPAVGWLVRGLKKRVANASHVMEKS
jgi:hypothetical protein